MKLSRADFEWLRDRATITTAIKNAWSSLQKYGKQLWAEVDRNARVKSAEQRAERAEQQRQIPSLSGIDAERKSRAAGYWTGKNYAGLRYLATFMQRIEERSAETSPHVHGKGVII